MPAKFPSGHGGVHGIDECVSLKRLKRAMRIYVRTLIELIVMKKLKTFILGELYESPDIKNTKEFFS